MLCSSHSLHSPPAVPISNSTSSAHISIVHCPSRRSSPVAACCMRLKPHFLALPLLPSEQIVQHTHTHPPTHTHTHRDTGTHTWIDNGNCFLARKVACCKMQNFHLHSVLVTLARGGRGDKGERVMGRGAVSQEIVRVF